MAGVNFSTTVEVTTGVAVLTLMQIVAAANRRLRINRVVVSGKGILNTDVPVTVELVEQSTAGTSSANGTVYKANASDDETLGVTTNITYTVEPTLTAIKASRNIHPQSSAEFVFPVGQRDLFVAGGGRLGIRCGVAPGQATTLRVTVEGEE